jgi:pimeloyl-ACP methyl ester carboxylesterase
MVTFTKNILIEGSKEKPILLDVCYKQTHEAKPIVIFVHGFKGFKDWGHFDLLAKEVAQQDFVFIKFNFSYNGTTPENPLEFVDLDAFGNNNYIIELNDLEKVIDWALSDPSIAQEVDKEAVYLIGHSRGGGIAILKAAEDPRVKKLVTWASVSDFLNRNKKRTIDTWHEIGIVYTFNSRTQQQMPLYLQFYETMQENKERLNIVKAVKHLSIPFLIVHGTKDDAVDLKDAEELHRAGKHSELLVVGEANHTFGAKHPFEELSFTEHTQFVVERSLAFLKE